jgi:hypothetical protein
MTIFYILEPEVAGDLGEKSVLDFSTHPPTVLKLHYKFNVWLGDDLITTHPCFIVTERLRKALDELGGTGYQFDEVEVSTSEYFGVVNPKLELPIFYWMKVHGVPGVDDVGVTEDKKQLVVSDRFLNVLGRFNTQHCIIRRKPYHRQT